MEHGIQRPAPQAVQVEAQRTGDAGQRQLPVRRREIGTAQLRGAVELCIGKVRQRQAQMELERAATAERELGQRIGRTAGDRTPAGEVQQARAAAATAHIEVEQSLAEVRNQRHRAVHLHAQRMAGAGLHQHAAVDEAGHRIDAFGLRPFVAIVEGQAADLGPRFEAALVVVERPVRQIAAHQHLRLLDGTGDQRAVQPGHGRRRHHVDRPEQLRRGNVGVVDRGVQTQPRRASGGRQHRLAARVAGIAGADEFQAVGADVPVSILRPECQRAGQFRQRERLAEHVGKRHRGGLRRQLQREGFGVPAQHAAQAAQARRLVHRIDAEPVERHGQALQSGRPRPVQRELLEFATRTPAAKPARQGRRQVRLQRQPRQQRRQLQLARGGVQAKLRRAGLIQLHHRGTAVVAGPAQRIAGVPGMNAGQAMQRRHFGHAARRAAHRQRVQVDAHHAVAQLALTPVDPRAEAAGAVFDPVTFQVDAIEQGFQVGCIGADPQLP